MVKTEKMETDESSKDELLEKVDKVCNIKFEDGELTINCEDQEVAVGIKEKIEKEGLRIKAGGVKGPEPE